jgi:hypothetical protein
MRRRRMVPPPEKATWADAYRIGLGLLMIPLGVTILVRSIAEGIVTPPAMLMGLLFIGFGAYRLYVGIVRYRMYRTAPGSSNPPRER